MQNFPSEKRNRKSKKDWATNKNETKNSSKTKMKNKKTISATQKSRIRKQNEQILREKKIKESWRNKKKTFFFRQILFKN